MVYMRGWLPSTPTEAISATLETPTIVPVGAPAAVVFKSITKTAGIPLGKAALIGGAGLLGGLLLGGGGGQEVTPVQETTQKPTMDLRERFEARQTQAIRDLFQRAKGRAEAKAETDVTAAPIITPTYSDITAGRDITFGGITVPTTTPTVVEAGVTQEQLGQLALALARQQQTPEQITTAVPTQTTIAAKADMGIIALIAVAGIAALMFLKGGKK